MVPDAVSDVASVFFTDKSGKDSGFVLGKVQFVVKKNPSGTGKIWRMREETWKTHAAAWIGFAEDDGGAAFSKITLGGFSSIFHLGAVLTHFKGERNGFVEKFCLNNEFLGIGIGVDRKFVEEWNVHFLSGKRKGNALLGIQFIFLPVKSDEKGLGLFGSRTGGWGFHGVNWKAREFKRKRILSFREDFNGTKVGNQKVNALSVCFEPKTG